MSENIYPKLAQGEAKPATPVDIAHDQGGITYPNLHRRIDNDATPLAEGELEPDKYTVSVSSVDSYRTTKHIVHDEESTTSEVP